MPRIMGRDSEVTVVSHHINKPTISKFILPTDSITKSQIAYHDIVTVLVPSI